MRLPALLYAQSKYDRNKHLDDQLWLMGGKQETMVAALCICAEDSAVLVQRMTLDLIINALPLSSKQVSPFDGETVL